MTINYNNISAIYDDVRQANLELINTFRQEVDLNASTKVLDIGCGTGNNADLIQKITHSQLYGLEPSTGMLHRATQKNENILFKQGHAADIPFEDDYFDFIYMTDVIHHIPDIKMMFAEIKRVLKKNGKICIVTQSHQQIEKRPIVQFFPDTANVDKARYPDIETIIAVAGAQNLSFSKTSPLYEVKTVELGSDFLELVMKKGYSMLHLISDKEYQHGLKVLKSALEKGPLKLKAAGETLIWFMNKE